MAKKNPPTTSQPWEADKAPQKEPVKQVENFLLEVSDEDAKRLNIKAGEHPAEKVIHHDGAEEYRILDADGTVLGFIPVTAENDPREQEEEEDKQEQYKGTVADPDVTAAELEKGAKNAKKKESAAISKTTIVKRLDNKALKVGDHLPAEVIHYMTVNGCSTAEAIEHYNSKL